MADQGNDGTNNQEGGNTCRDYQRGVCHRGSKCKFDHPPNVTAPTQERLPICRDFQNGKCDRNNCKYMHITSQEERVYMRTGQLPSNTSNVESPQTSNGPTGDQVCKDFLNNICNRGNNCKFLHVPEDDYQRQKGGSEDVSRKRRRDSYGSGVGGGGSGNGGGMDMQFMQEENDMLRRKVADLQRQVADLRTMNDTLYEQNTRYRTQMQSGMDNGGSRNNLQYSSYSRESAPGYGNYAPGTGPPGVPGYDSYS